MPKILEMPSTRAQKKKYGHDLSQLLKFTSSVGHILPVYYDLSQPGDKYKINTEMFTQITDLVSPAMMKITEHVDWFFIPLKQISAVAGNSLYGVDDNKSSLIGRVDENIIPLIPSDLVRNNVCDDWEGYGLTYAQSDYKDVYGVPTYFNGYRLGELLGFSTHIFDPQYNDDSANVVYFNPMLLCAYQKCFYDHYRITDRTPNKVEAYNLDSFISSGICNNDVVIQELFTIHYRAFARDFFQITFPAPLVDKGDIGMMGGNGNSDTLTQFNNWLGFGTAVNPAIPDTAQDHDLSISGSSAGAYPTNTALLRGMFAVEKLMEITRRAAKRYDAQTLAHYGVKVPEGISDMVYRIGEEQSLIQVNEVIATAVGSATVDGEQLTSTVGERGGKAASYKPAKRNIKFTAPCHGILLACYSAVPEADYDQSGLERINTYRTRYDFYQPEFDSLGMQPLFGYQLQFVFDTLANSQVYGWQYRYQELKLKYNRCCGAFNSTYDNWTVKRFAAFNHESDYYVNPDYLDNVLLLHFHNGDEDIINKEMVFARDPLLHWFKFNVFKSSIMNVYSLPQL